MMKRLVLLVSPILALLLASQSMALGAGLVVYPPVPGLADSEHYKVRVRPASDGGEWQSAFAWETVCKTIEKKTDAYFDTLAGWTHTYVNFETVGAVEIEIARVNGQPIYSAAVHPKRKASACSVRDGKVLVRLDQPCLVAVDIDGQMDTQDTGMGYNGPPIHTISLFANPLLENKPKPDEPGVLAVKPGEIPPSDGPWTTLYFLPGVHDVGLAFPLRANRQYYIPGDAMVYGTLSNAKWGDGHHIRIFGHGTLSGARTKHPKYVEPAISEKEHGRYRPIELVGTTDTCVEGITIADSATHSLMLIHPYKAGHPNEVKWTKIFTWRANGDGINPFGNTLIEDCFLRTQDDSLYVSGLGIRRTVLWNDANGSSFVLSSLPQLTDRKLVVEDCDVIYSRAKWHHWSGGRVFNMRGEGGGEAGAGVVFRNINIEDPRPTLQQFFICMAVPEPYSKNAEKRAAGDLSGIVFQNISIAAPSVQGEPQVLWGQADAHIRNLTFENLTLAGKPVRDPGFFKSNEFVEGLSFAPGSMDFTQRIPRVLPKSAIFRQPGWCLWDPCIVKGKDGLYHLLYSRWKTSLGYDAWCTHAEIAWAVSPKPEGPYEFRGTVLPQRGVEFWDGHSVFNTCVIRIGETFYLYYTGNRGTADWKPDRVIKGNSKEWWVHRNKQRIGVAAADSPGGPWKRLDQPILDVGQGFGQTIINVPVMIQKPDGGLRLYYKTLGEGPGKFGSGVFHFAADAETPTGPFHRHPQPMVNKNQLMPQVKKPFDFHIDDHFEWWQDDRYYAIVKDHDAPYLTPNGRSLLLFESPDGLTWHPSSHSLVQDFSIRWDDGKDQTFERLEMPKILMENGQPRILALSALEQGAKESFLVIVPLSVPK